MKAGAVAAAAAIPTVAVAEDAKEAPPAPSAETPRSVLPKRKLGKSGVEITMLGQGTAPPLTDRHFNVMHDMGIRFVDTAKAYLKGKSERSVGAWLSKSGHRKEYFLVSKDVVNDPTKWMASLDERLENLGLDSLDAFYLHGMGDEDYITPERVVSECFKNKAWRKAADEIRSSGKCRLLGFSSHTTPLEKRTALLNHAAADSWVDVIMVAADPVSIRHDAAFNKSLDACHKAGIGLISMKECWNNAKDIDKVFPKFQQLGLNQYTAILSFMWTDERFTAICSHMDTLEKLRENAETARSFKPLAETDLAAVDTAIQQGDRRLCLNCDGSCRRAAGTNADLNRIARYVNYAEHDGRVYEARELLLAMAPEARDWAGADLEAATRACRCGLDYAAIIKRAEQLLA